MLTHFDEVRFRAAIERAQWRATMAKLMAFATRVEAGRRGSRLNVDRIGDDAYLASERGIYSKLVPGYHQTWRKLRLRCQDCDGYLVPCRAGSGKFAPCGNYESAHCGFSLDWASFLNEKHYAVRAHLGGNPSPWPYLILGEHRTPVSPESDMWHDAYSIEPT
jgi:hypothetical protein